MPKHFLSARVWVKASMILAVWCKIFRLTREMKWICYETLMRSGDRTDITQQCSFWRMHMRQPNVKFCFVLFCQTATEILQELHIFGIIRLWYSPSSFDRKLIELQDKIFSSRKINSVRSWNTSDTKWALMPKSIIGREKLSDHISPLPT